MNLSAGSSLKHSLSERLTWPKELKLLARKLVLLCPRAHELLFSQPVSIFSFSRHLVSGVHHGRDADFEDPLSRHRSWVTHLFLKIAEAGRANPGSSGFRLFSLASSALDNRLQVFIFKFQDEILVIVLHVFFFTHWNFQGAVEMNGRPFPRTLIQVWFARGWMI